MSPSLAMCSIRRLTRGATVLALFGGAAAALLASPLSAQVRPLAAAGTSSFQVYLVLPPASGLSGSKTAATTTEQLSAFSLSATTSGGAASSTGAAAGKAALPVVTATMPVDVVSTGLFRDVVSAVSLNPVEVVFRRQVNGKQQPFLTYTFKDAVISGYQLQDAQSNADVEVTLGFQAITATFGTGAATSATGTVGTVPAGWNITTNKAV